MYSIDKIEEEIALLEDINTGEKKEIPIQELPSNSKEGTIIEYKNQEYIINEQEEKDRRERIRNKFEKLKK